MEMTFAQMLDEAATEPGMFKDIPALHSFSLGNQILAFVECRVRGIDFGPIATYKRWSELGRQVRRGEKAITLCMPRTIRVKDADSETGEKTFTKFVFKPLWFVLSQTDGEELTFDATPTWNAYTAIEDLEIKQTPFESARSTVHGYSFPNRKMLAINPLAPEPTSTLIHEIAHILLHADDPNGHERDVHDLREVEAEAATYLVLASLGLDGLESARAYVQSYLKGQAVPERNAKRIFQAADKILRAGRTSTAASEEVAA